MTSKHPNHGPKAPAKKNGSENQPDHADRQISPTPSEPEVPSADRNASSPNNQEKHWIDYATFGVGVAGLLGLVAYCVITYGVFCENKKAADAAKTAADAAIISAGAIRPSLAVTLLTPQPLTAQGTPIDNGVLHVGFQLPNYGPVAAQEAQICEFDYVGVPGSLGPRPYQNCKSSAGWGYGSPIIPPVTALNGTQAPGWGMDGTTRISAEEIVGMRTGVLRAVFSILAMYQDAAHRVHHSEGCIVFTMQPKNGTQTIGIWGSTPCQWKMQND